MEFLGYTQAFVGFLASLMTVCIVIESKSNFILNIYSEVTARINKSIKKYDLETSFKEQFKNLQNGISYKLFERYIYELRQNSSAKEEDLNEALKLDCMILSKYNEITNIHRVILKPINDYKLINRNNKKKDSRLIIIGPLYAMFYCVMLFLADMLINNASNINSDVIVTFFSLFLLISTIFWFMIWFDFLFESNKLDIFKKIYSRLVNIKFPMLCLTSLYIVIYVICWFISIIIKFLWLKYVILIFLGIICPIIIVSFAKLDNNESSKKSSFLFVTNHFIVFIILSVFHTIITFIFVNNINSSLMSCLYYEDMTLLRNCSILFILCIGLIFPLFIPYLKYISILVKTEYKLSKARSSVEKDLKGIKKELEKFCKRIPNLNQI